MIYLGIALALLIVIAPIIAILPSKRQKEQMALRSAGKAQGFSVELTRIADPDPDPEKYVSSTGKPLERVMGVIAYRYPRKRPLDWRRLPPVDWCVARKSGKAGAGLPDGWVWDEEMSHVARDQLSNELKDYFLNKLAELPNDAVRVDEKKYTISVYWNERGGDAALAAIVAFIKGCAELTPVKTRVDGDDADA